MSLLDDDDDEDLAVAPSNLPVVSVECAHRLVYKLEQHAIALYQAANDGVPSVTFNREGMLEVSTAILQLLSILRSKKGAS